VGWIDVTSNSVARDWATTEGLQSFFSRLQYRKSFFSWGSMLAPFSYGSAGCAISAGRKRPEVRDGAEGRDDAALPMFQSRRTVLIWKWTPNRGASAAKRLCLFPGTCAHVTGDEAGEWTEPVAG
jgi:hypothetical protein